MTPVGTDTLILAFTLILSLQGIRRTTFCFLLPNGHLNMKTITFCIILHPVRATENVFCPQTGKNDKYFKVFEDILLNANNFSNFNLIKFLNSRILNLFFFFVFQFLVYP